MIQIPEVHLKSIIDAILDKVKADYISNGNNSFLYKCYNGVVSGNYNFFDQAVKIFNRTIDDPRTIDTRLLFDRERASLPTIHVTVPSEQPNSDGIGFDEGYQVNEINDPGYDIHGDPIKPTTLTTYYTRSYGSRFELIITGSNTFEVILIFSTLKMALINNLVSLEINGFRNPKIYGGDMKINDQLAASAYMRILTLDSFYELNVPKFDNISIVNNINFIGTAYGIS